MTKLMRQRITFEYFSDSAIRSLANAFGHNLYYEVIYSMDNKFAGKQETSLPSLRGHIWIEGSEGTFLGYGRLASHGANQRIRLHHKGCKVAGDTLPEGLVAY